MRPMKAETSEQRTSPNQMTEFRFMFVAERHEWMGVVLADDGETLLTVACEPTEAAIIAWYETYAASGGAVETDMYDRADKQ
jgi:hypothetical protein